MTAMSSGFAILPELKIKVVTVCERCDELINNHQGNTRDLVYL